MRFQCGLLVLWVLSTLGRSNIQIKKSLQTSNATVESDFAKKPEQITITKPNYVPPLVRRKRLSRRGSLSPNAYEKTTRNWKKARYLPDGQIWKKTVDNLRQPEALHARETAVNGTDKEGFPFWIFILLFPLMCAVIVSITCFVVYMKAYNEANKESQQSSKSEQQQQQIKSESIKEVERFCAGLPVSALDKHSRESDATSEPYKPKVKEGGIGSIMRDPDLDSAAREEAPRTYKMVYKGNKWSTVSKVPSDISFHIPSETFLSAY